MIMYIKILLFDLNCRTALNEFVKNFRCLEFQNKLFLYPILLVQCCNGFVVVIIGAAREQAKVDRATKHAMRTHHRLQRERKQLGLAPLRKRKKSQSLGMTAEEQAAQDRETTKRT